MGNSPMGGSGGRSDDTKISPMQTSLLHYKLNEGVLNKGKKRLKLEVERKKKTHSKNILKWFTISWILDKHWGFVYRAMGLLDKILIMLYTYR